MEELAGEGGGRSSMASGGRRRLISGGSMAKGGERVARRKNRERLAKARAWWKGFVTQLVCPKDRTHGELFGGLPNKFLGHLSFRAATGDMF
jgi:hypothetical protein